MSNETVVAIERRDAFVLATLNTSEMDEDRSRRLQDTVSSCLADAGSLPVVLDFSSVSFVPSLSLGVLVTLQNEAKRAGRRFVLVGLRPPVREVLALTRLDKLFDICDTVADAQAHLSTASG